MDIKEFKVAKKQLEIDIAFETQKLITEFEKETSYTPHNISTNMFCMDELGKEMVFVVNWVNVDIRL